MYVYMCDCMYLLHIALLLLFGGVFAILRTVTPCFHSLFQICKKRLPGETELKTMTDLRFFVVMAGICDQLHIMDAFNLSSQAGQAKLDKVSESVSRCLARLEDCICLIASIVLASVHLPLQLLCVSACALM